MTQKHYKIISALLGICLFLSSCDTGTSQKGGNPAYRLTSSSYINTMDFNSYTRKTFYEYVSGDACSKSTNYVDDLLVDYDIYEYNNRGCLIKSTTYMPDDSLIEYTFYSDFTTYGDAQGIKTYTNADELNNEAEFVYSYNNRGQKISESIVGAEPTETVLEFVQGPAFEFLISGNFEYISLFSTLIKFEYDDFGNCVIKRYYCGNEQNLIYTLMLFNEYDDNGNLVRVTGSNGYVWQYEWEAY